MIYKTKSKYELCYIKTGPYIFAFVWYDTDYSLVLCCLHRLYSIVGVIPKESLAGLVTINSSMLPKFYNFPLNAPCSLAFYHQFLMAP